MTRSSRFVHVLCLGVLIAACSQEDPDSGSNAGSGAGTGGAGSGAVLEGDYFPLADGARYTYRYLGGAMTWDQESTYAAGTHEGKPAVLVSSTANLNGKRNVNTLVVDGTRILRVKQEEFMGNDLLGWNEYEPGFLRFDTTYPSKDQGYSETLDYMRTAKNTSGAVLNADTRMHEYTIVAASETVTVIAGTFENCIQVQRMRVRAQGSVIADDDNKTYWFCPGVGKVKELTMTTGETEELVSCNVPGGLSIQ